MSSSSVDDHFMEFLQTLGWSVDVKNHPGWTGLAPSAHRSKRHSIDDITEDGKHCSNPTSRNQSSRNNEYEFVSFFFSTANENITGESDDSSAEHGGSIYNGTSRVLYWADGFSEIAFIVPTPSPATIATQQARTFTFITLPSNLNDTRCVFCYYWDACVPIVSAFLKIQTSKSI